MRIAYWTTDEVNEDLAHELTTEGGDRLCPLTPKDWPPSGEYDAVLYDWDHLPADLQQEVMRGLLSGPLPHAAAVHGYNLGDGRAEALRRHTVVVYRRLQPLVFRFLRRAARTVRAARAVGRSPQAEPRPAGAHVPGVDEPDRYCRSNRDLFAGDI
jgi:hypothetical protein